MLLCVYILQEALCMFVSNEQDRKLWVLTIINSEWEQVHYLLTLLKLFKEWTAVLSKITEVTIHKTWYVYNQLIDHIADHCHWVQLKTTSWKQKLITALKTCQNKLKNYYEGSQSIQRQIYNLATVLDSSCKMIKYQIMSPHCLLNLI